MNDLNALGIDLGLNIIATMSDNMGNNPLIIKGGVIKSINQFYNKQLSKYKSIAKKCNKMEITNQIKKQRLVAAFSFLLYSI